MKLCEKHGFLRRIVHPKLEMYKIESTGVLLQENLRAEWFYNIVINKDIQMFHCIDNFSETYNFAKQTSLGITPFGVTQITPKKLSVQEQAEKTDFEKYFDSSDIYESWVFLAPKNVTQFFHQWQNERRMWWRKVFT